MCKCTPRTYASSSRSKSRTMCKCGDCCSEQCNCRCGESILTVGVVIVLAACVFWLGGLLPYLCDQVWYHEVNKFFFYLGGAMVVIGPIYAVCDRKGKAFSREAAEADDEAKVGEEASAPTPYIMLTA